jgi:oligoendopeptidase F
MDHIGIQARRESAKLVIAKVKEMCGEEPYILTGDFNVDQHNEVYGILTAPGAFVDALSKTNRKFVTNGTTSGFDANRYSDSRIDHIFISNRFYVYKYATGIISAVSIAERIYNEGDAAVADYFKFLSSGGSDSPVELLKLAGVDLTKMDAFNSCMASFKAALEEFEALD